MGRTRASRTAASAAYAENTAYSSSHLLFQFGVDGRFGVAAMNGSLNIDSSKQKNYVFLKFTQKYFDVLFEDPTTSTSVFRDGDGFAGSRSEVVSGGIGRAGGNTGKRRQESCAGLMEHIPQFIVHSLSFPFRANAGGWPEYCFLRII